MSNLCFVNFVFEFETIENRNIVLDFFHQKIDDMKNKGEKSIFIGSEDCYLFDCHCFDYKDDIKLCIDGYVNWAIDDKDMISILNYLKTLFSIKSLILEYEEFTNDVLGKYIYENGILRDYYLTMQQFSKVYNQSDYSKFVEEEIEGEEEELYEQYHLNLYKELNDNPTIKILS